MKKGVGKPSAVIGLNFRNRKPEPTTEKPKRRVRKTDNSNLVAIRLNQDHADKLLELTETLALDRTAVIRLAIEALYAQTKGAE